LLSEDGGFVEFREGVSHHLLTLEYICQRRYPLNGHAIRGIASKMLQGLSRKPVDYLARNLCFRRRIWAHQISLFVPCSRSNDHPSSGSAQDLLRLDMTIARGSCLGETPGHDLGRLEVKLAGGGEYGLESIST
jgi:hypothetical protein